MCPFIRLMHITLAYNIKYAMTDCFINLLSEKAINLLNYVRISVHSDTTNQLCKIFSEHHYWQLQPLCANKHCALLVTVMETKCLWPLWKGNSLGSWSAVKQLKYSHACSEERTRMQQQGNGRFNHFYSTKMSKVNTG